MQNIVMAGCGAVGSRLALEVGAPGLSFLLIDDDRIDANNVRTGSTIYWSQHIGAFKTVALGEMLYRRWGCDAVADTEMLTENRVIVTYRQFVGAQVVVDGFDNVAARRLLVDMSGRNVPPVLHVGVSAAGSGIVAWGDKYELPDLAPPRGENPVCTHQLGRGIITFTASVAALIVSDFLATGKMRSVITTRALGVIDL